MNIFTKIYNWFFVNSTIDEQIDAHRADMILLSYYKEELKKQRLKIKQR
jgi:hypothetical protein